jgi:CBS-domain-containing membrane protein
MVAMLIQRKKPDSAALRRVSEQIMRNELVRHIMTVEVLSIDIRESITEAMRLFASYPVHHLPMVDQEGLRGILSNCGHAQARVLPS